MAQNTEFVNSGLVKRMTAKLIEKQKESRDVSIEEVLKDTSKIFPQENALPELSGQDPQPLDSQNPTIQDPVGEEEDFREMTNDAGVVSTLDDIESGDTSFEDEFARLSKMAEGLELDDLAEPENEEQELLQTLVKDSTEKAPGKDKDEEEESFESEFERLAKMAEGLDEDALDKFKPGEDEDSFESEFERLAKMAEGLDEDALDKFKPEEDEDSFESEFERLAKMAEGLEPDALDKVIAEKQTQPQKATDNKFTDAQRAELEFYQPMITYLLLRLKELGVQETEAVSMSQPKGNKKEDEEAKKLKDNLEREFRSGASSSTQGEFDLWKRNLEDENQKEFERFKSNYRFKGGKVYRNKKLEAFYATDAQIDDETKKLAEQEFLEDLFIKSKTTKPEDGKETSGRANSGADMVASSYVNIVWMNYAVMRLYMPGSSQKAYASLPAEEKASTIEAYFKASVDGLNMLESYTTSQLKAHNASLPQGTPEAKQLPEKSPVMEQVQKLGIMSGQLNEISLKSVKGGKETESSVLTELKAGGKDAQKLAVMKPLTSKFQPKESAPIEMNLMPAKKESFLDKFKAMFTRSKKSA